MSRMNPGSLNLLIGLSTSCKTIIIQRFQNKNNSLSTATKKVTAINYFKLCGESLKLFDIETSLNVFYKPTKSTELSTKLSANPAESFFNKAVFPGFVSFFSDFDQRRGGMILKWREAQRNNTRRERDWGFNTAWVATVGGGWREEVIILGESGRRQSRTNRLWNPANSTEQREKRIRRQIRLKKSRGKEIVGEETGGTTGANKGMLP